MSDSSKIHMFNNAMTFPDIPIGLQHRKFNIFPFLRCFSSVVVLLLLYEYDQGSAARYISNSIIAVSLAMMIRCLLDVLQPSPNA